MEPNTGIPAPGSGDSQAADNAGVSDQTSKPAEGGQQSFDPAADQLRAENQELRARLSKLESTTKQAEEARLAKQGEFEQLASKRGEELEMIRGELLRERRDNALTREATKAGLRDLEFLKLIDPKTIEVTTEGEIRGVTEAIAGLKEKHADLFADAKPHGVRTPTHTPTGGKPQGFDPQRAYTSEEIMGMDPETFKAFRNRDKPTGGSKLGF